MLDPGVENIPREKLHCVKDHLVEDRADLDPEIFKLRKAAEAEG